MSTRVPLTEDQARHVARARQILDMDNPADLAGMAGRIGALWYHLDAMLDLIDQLTGGTS